MKHPRRQLGNPPYARVASLLLVLTLWATPARAQTARDDAARAVQLNEAGAELYAAGNYAAALAAFERAYSLIMEPNLLFNIAGCYERLGQPARAVEYYQRFVRAPLADPEGRQRALESLESLEATALETAAPDTPAPAPKEPNAWTHPAWPLLTLGTGILLAGLGTGLYLDGARDHDEVTGAANYGDVSRPSSMTEVEAQRLIDAGDTKKLIGAIGLGVGGALIATHVVLTVWRSARGEASQVRAELRLVPGGCLVTGSF
jgi:tetratricopeptide (TPR) repeat protein